MLHVLQQMFQRYKSATNCNIPFIFDMPFNYLSIENLFLLIIYIIANFVV
jgi:hypothetical protein